MSVLIATNFSTNIMTSFPKLNLPPDEDFEVTVSCNCYSLRRAARRATQLYDHLLAPTGLRATQYMMLAEIAKRGPISLGHLAKCMIMDSRTIGKNVQPLEAAGYIARHPGKDRRVKEISLTSAGQRAFEDAKPYWRKAQQAFEAKVGADEALALRQALALVADIDFLSDK